MSVRDRLAAEILDVIHRLKRQGRVIATKWVAHEVCSLHKGALPDDEHGEFWHHVGYEGTREAARRFINDKLGGVESRSAEKAKQRTLPGYEHLQDYYQVLRDGEKQSVPRWEMSDDEIELKIAEIEDMGRGCFAHADELRRYKRERRSGKAA